MVRIRAFQAWGPGSIPGRRKKYLFFLITIEERQRERERPANAASEAS